jgi:PTS system nitrogen regulatory IIA component
MLTIADLINREAIELELETTDKHTAIAALCDRLLKAHPRLVEQISRERARRALEDRERLGSTALGGHLAIPHAVLPGLTGHFGAFARCTPGLDFGALDKKPSHYIFMLLSSAEDPKRHLRVLATIARVLGSEPIQKAIMAATSAAEIFETLATAEVSATPGTSGRRSL